MRDGNRVSQSASPRVRTCLNRGWTFHRGACDGADRPGFDDAAWPAVGLPHTFDLPYFRTPEFYVGQGWYRRRFGVPADWAGRRVWLEFEGAFQVATVHVNGHVVGTHEGGYTPFTFDVTDAIRPGENVLAVRVDNTWNPRLAPRAGEHIFSGGLYRDVYLLAVDPVHVAWHGTAATTPAVSAERATVAIATEVRNDGRAAVTCTVTTEIAGPDGAVVSGGEPVTATVGPGTAATVVASADVPDPRLWHPDHPYLYTARTAVSVEGGVVDRVDTPFGIRWFEWTADRGFFLNGEHLYLRGANVHQDQAGLGHRHHAGGRRAGRAAGQGRRVQLRPRGPLPAPHGVRRRLRPAGADLLVRGPVLGQGRVRARGVLERQRLPGRAGRPRAVRGQLPAGAGRDDPHAPQPPVDRRLEHDQRGVLHLRPGAGASADGRPRAGEPRARPDPAGGHRRGPAGRRRPPRRRGRVQRRRGPVVPRPRRAEHGQRVRRDREAARGVRAVLRRAAARAVPVAIRRGDLVRVRLRHDRRAAGAQGHPAPQPAAQAELALVPAGTAGRRPAAGAGRRAGPGVADRGRPGRAERHRRARGRASDDHGLGQGRRAGRGLPAGHAVDRVRPRRAADRPGGHVRGRHRHPDRRWSGGGRVPVVPRRNVRAAGQQPRTGGGDGHDHHRGRAGVRAGADGTGRPAVRPPAAFGGGPRRR